MNKKEVYYFGVTLFGTILFSYLALTLDNDRLAGLSQNIAAGFIFMGIIGVLMDFGWKKIFG